MAAGRASGFVASDGDGVIPGDRGSKWRWWLSGRCRRGETCERFFLGGPFTRTTRHIRARAGAVSVGSLPTVLPTITMSKVPITVDLRSPWGYTEFTFFFLSITLH